MCYCILSNWLQEVRKDLYAREAKKQKLRSRAWFKLDEINRIDGLFRYGMTVVELGSVPGGWSLYIKTKIGNTGQIFACDLLPMQKISGVNFLQGDCSNPVVLKILFSQIKCRKAQIVLSDMSPNITGISIIDVSRSIYLGYIALDICRSILVSKGTFVVKVFQGEDFDEYLHNICSLFHIVRIRKPCSSRSSSREVYIVAKQYKL